MITSTQGLAFHNMIMEPTSARPIGNADTEFEDIGSESNASSLGCLTPGSDSQIMSARAMVMTGVRLVHRTR